MSAPAMAEDVLTRMSLRSGEGFRVTVSDARGPIVSIWDVSRAGAGRKADALHASLHRASRRFGRRRAS